MFYIELQTLILTVIHQQYKNMCDRAVQTRPASARHHDMKEIFILKIFQQCSPVSSSELGHCIVLKLNVALLDEIGELSFREICTTEKWSLEKLYFLYFFLNCFN